MSTRARSSAAPRAPGALSWPLWPSWLRGWGHFYVTLNTPAIAPQGEAIPNTELFRRLAARMGFEDDHFRLSDAELLAQAYDWSSPVMEGITLESLGETGWARLNLPGPDAYAPHAEGGFPTPSGKTEFRSSALEAAGNFVVPLFRQLYEEFQPGGVVDPLPHYVPPQETSDSHPLNLLSPKSHAFLNSSAADQAAQKRVQGEQTVTRSTRSSSPTSGTRRRSPTPGRRSPRSDASGRCRSPLGRHRPVTHGATARGRPGGSARRERRARRAAHGCGCPVAR